MCGRIKCGTQGTEKKIACAEVFSEVLQPRCSIFFFSCVIDQRQNKLSQEVVSDIPMPANHFLW